MKDNPIMAIFVYAFVSWMTAIFFCEMLWLITRDWELWIPILYLLACAIVPMYFLFGRD